MFLRLFVEVRREWQRELSEGGYVDFEDMLEQAAGHVERGEWTSPFDLVMVDEFQDASFARARLVRALVEREEARLFAVGDDWQSINRFAGADLSVMTDFEELFGAATTLRLERTFRSPQALCDLAGEFVAQNPAQLTKTVRSHVPASGPAARVVSVGHENEYRSAVTSWLHHLNEEARGPRRATVLVLGRYNRLAEALPTDAGRRWPKLDVQFLSVHRSKGLEADYVVIPGMTRRSFPSAVRDDSVLQFAMPQPEAFPAAEERRLFYVALTRARRGVVLLTVKGRESTFITELVERGGLETTDEHGERVHSIPCDACGKGALIERRGQYGVFLGCSEFPRCRNTKRVGAQAQVGTRTSRR
jgi:DNA helicase IV